jgi:hypothetical protein
MPAMKARRSAKCLGLITSACNTLAFTSVRKYWVANYPDAIIFGTFRTIGHGWQVTNAIAGAKMTTGAFWRDPASVLKTDADCEELALQIALKFPRSRRDFGIGFIYKGKVYMSRYSRRKTSVEVYAAGADLPHSKEAWDS